MALSTGTSWHKQCVNLNVRNNFVCHHSTFVVYYQPCLVHIAACQMNRRIDIRDFAIYAVLTDTKQWEFLAYDGAKQKFYRDEPISLYGRPLEDHWLYIRSMVGGKLLISY